jgi:hypothetical protein
MAVGALLVVVWQVMNWFECAAGGVHHPQHTQTSEINPAIIEKSRVLFMQFPGSTD